MYQFKKTVAKNLMALALSAFLDLPIWRGFSKKLGNFFASAK
jgi:hypothetical protein